MVIYVSFYLVDRSYVKSIGSSTSPYIGLVKMGHTVREYHTRESFCHQSRPCLFKEENKPRCYVQLYFAPASAGKVPRVLRTLQLKILI